MDISNLLSLILTKYPSVYTSESAQNTLISNIEKMNPLLRISLEKVLKNKEAPEINLLGYTVETLKINHGMNEIAAYLTLDWILKEPDQALHSLEKGHDKVNISL